MTLERPLNEQIGIAERICISKQKDISEQKLSTLRHNRDSAKHSDLRAEWHHSYNR
jgi:G3E family GTPase